MKKMHRKKVLLLWYMQGGNFGDLLIADTVRTFLRSLGINTTDCDVGVPCKDVMEIANSCDFLLFVGGGIIERYIPNVIRYFRDDYHLLNVPYGVMGFGMGTFDYSEYAEQLRFWVRNASFFFVRDAHTRDYLNNLIGQDVAIFSADCVFANKNLTGIHEISSSNSIGVNIRSLPYKDITGDFNWNEIREMVRACDCSVFIPDSDDDFWQAAEELLDIKIPKRKYDLLTSNEKIQATIKELRLCKFVVAMRFHIVLAAALLGVVPIPIAYCPKVAYLARQLGIEDLTVNINEIGMIPVVLEKAKNNRDFYVKVLSDNIEIMKKKATLMFDDVGNILVNDYDAKTGLA